jgi:hypothetical protein
MAWVKVDDQFFRHPKVMAAGRDARDLYLVGLCYCAQSLTDGFVPSQAVRVLAAEAEIDTGPASAARLVEVGLWEPTEAGYRVHDYLEYQPSKDQVLHTREVRAEAGRRGGKQKASNLLDKSPSKTLAKSKQNSAPYPSRTHPDPVPIPVPADRPTGEGMDRPVPSHRAPRPHPLPPEFALDDDMRAWAAEFAPDADAETETRKFVARSRDQGKLSADWRGAWEGWMLSPYATKDTQSRASPNGHAPPRHTGRDRKLPPDEAAEVARQLRRNARAPNGAASDAIETTFTYTRKGTP